MSGATEVEERFWEKVDVRGPDECWPWTAGHYLPPHHPYGRFKLDGHTRPAHVVAWLLTHGPIPPETPCVCHTCDNPPCCNPACLFLDTRAGNNADRDRKGRTAKHEDHPRAKLTEVQVREIRARYRRFSRGPDSGVALAREFNVSPSAIYFIVRGENWND